MVNPKQESATPPRPQLSLFDCVCVIVGIIMGDLNGVIVAQEAHERLLLAGGVLRPEEFVLAGAPLLRAAYASWESRDFVADAGPL